MQIFWSWRRGNIVEKAKWSLWLRKQEVDVKLAKWIAEKRKQPRSETLTSPYKYIIGYPTNLFKPAE